MAALQSANQSGSFTAIRTLLVRAGGCTFDDKMRTAISVGASALIVAKTLAQQYDVDATPEAPATAMQLANPCAVDCGRGRGLVNASALAVADVLAGLPGRCSAIAYDHSACSTGLCAFAGPGSNSSSAPVGTAGEREVCCALDTSPLQMILPNASSTRGDVPALYLPLSLGQRMQRECSGGSGGEADASSRAGQQPQPQPQPQRARLSACEVKLSEAEAGEEAQDGRWDSSALLVFAIGVGSASLAAYLAGNDQDDEDREVRERGELPPAEISQATLDVSTALAFPLMASALLVMLYFLLQAGITSIILVLVNLLYVLAAGIASASVAFLPVVGCLWPSLSAKVVRLPACIGEAMAAGQDGGTYLTLLEAASMLLGLLTSTVWFIHRRMPWMWLLQDGLSVCVCVMFVRAMRLLAARRSHLPRPHVPLRHLHGLHLADDLQEVDHGRSRHRRRLEPRSRRRACAPGPKATPSRCCFSCRTWPPSARRMMTSTSRRSLLAASDVDVVSVVSGWSGGQRCDGVERRCSTRADVGTRSAASVVWRAAVAALGRLA